MEIYSSAGGLGYADDSSFEQQFQTYATEN